MGDTKYQELILDAIDQLRKRKARPDLERICHMLERRHGLKASDVHDELKRLVNQSIVIKVDYKGHTSYRNAAKWVRTKSQFFGFFSSADLSGNVLEAVEALNSGHQSMPNARGASIREIEKYLLNREAQSNLNIATLRAVLEKEVANGSLIQLPSGDFLPKTSAVSQSSKPDLNQSDNLKEDPGKRGRPISTRKRFKKTHGPDFLETASIVSTDSPEQPRCDYCLLTANANRTGEPEDLLVCKDCNAKAHPSCMDYTAELAARSQMSPWQCTDCKTCTICEDSGDGDSMLFCDLCDKGYHMNCHRPPVTIKPTGKWVCSYCSTDGKQELSQNSFQNVTSIDGALCLPTPCDSPVSEGTRDGSRDKNLIFVFEECLKNYPEVIPHAEKWSIEDVEKFFKCIGYQDEAPAFRDQEIDGQSLLLMKRSDVLTGLAIKLGPALKIYNHIKRLQSRLPDGHLL